VNFLTYLLSSQAVASLATHTSILSATVRSTISIPTLYCNGQVMNWQTVNSNAIIAGTSLISAYLSSVLSFHQNIDPTRSYTFKAADSIESMRQVLNSEVDAAVINPDLVRESSRGDDGQR
jgi:hypothetical protein